MSLKQIIGIATGLALAAFIGFCFRQGERGKPSGRDREPGNVGSGDPIHGPRHHGIFVRQITARPPGEVSTYCVTWSATHSTSPQIEQVKMRYAGVGPRRGK